MNAQPATQNSVARWLPIGAAGGLLAAVVVAGVISGSGGNASTTEPSTGFTDLPTTTLAAPAPTVTYDDVDETGDTIVKVPISGSLSNGSWGEEVERLQNRLKELGFEPGPFGKSQSAGALDAAADAIKNLDAPERVFPDR